MPIYERSEVLPLCLNSIKLQTFKNYEIVISTQNEYEKLINNKFLKDVKILNAALVKGFIQGNTNNAMNFCCGEWIKIMFSDDFLNNHYDLRTMCCHLLVLHLK